MELIPAWREEAAGGDAVLKTECPGTNASRRRPCGIAAVFLLFLMVAGCGLWKSGFSPPSGTAQDAPCRAVATDRATDAGMAGEDDRTRQDVFDRTYADCVGWRRVHGPG
jgi:hypothetical protein